MTLPLVSIITPSYNQSQSIEATIRSVLDQDYPHIEYLIMDGGSTDGTPEILRQFDGKLRWISEKDHGQSDAINRGIARTSGSIVAWLNSDDTYALGAVSAAVEYLQAHPDAALVYGEADFIDDCGRFICRCPITEPFNFNRLLNYSDFIVQPTSYIRREAWDTAGGVDQSLHFAMDYDLWLKIGEKHKIAFLPRLMANYRWSGENKSAVGGMERLEECERVARRHGAKGMPAYFQLERINMNLAEAREAFGQMRLGRGAAELGSAARKLVSSPRALLSLFSPHTWKIISRGRMLRGVKRR